MLFVNSNNTNKCVKAFFGYKRYDSLTKVLMDTGIPSFNTIISNCKYAFDISWSTSCNKLVSSSRSSLVWFVSVCVFVFVSFVCFFCLWAKGLK